MTTKPFKRYWAMTPDGLGLVIIEGRDLPFPDALIQINGQTKWYYLDRIRPATFGDFCWRDTGFAGTHYGLFFTVFAFCIMLTVYGIIATFPELWGKITCILAGPVFMGTWVGMTWLNFKRHVV